MVELKPISTDKHSNSSSNCCSTITSPSSSSNSSATPPSPASLLPMQPPLLLPDHPYSAPPPPHLNYHPHPLYFQFPQQQPYFSHYPYYPNIPYYSYPNYWTPQQFHFYPQSPPATSVPLPTPSDGGDCGGEAEKVAVAVEVPAAASGRRRRGWVIPRRFTGGPRNFHGFRLRKAKKMWKPKEASPVRTSPPPPIPQPLPRGCTTLMIKNIPNYISRRTLIDLLESHCRDENAIAEQQIHHTCSSEFDFLYLPFDFHRKKNLGYGFVNFTTAEGAARLHSSWNGLGWKGCPKIREITPARLQGKEKCVKHFQGSTFRCHSVEYLPLAFFPARNGANGSVSRMINIGTRVGPLGKKSLAGPV